MDFHDASCVGIICSMSDKWRPSTLSVMVGSFATGRDDEKLCRGDSPCDGLDWSVYQNHCFQPLGPTLQRRDLALLKSRPGAVTESTVCGAPNRDYQHTNAWGTPRSLRTEVSGKCQRKRTVDRLNPRASVTPPFNQQTLRRLVFVPSSRMITAG